MIGPMPINTFDSIRGPVRRRWQTAVIRRAIRQTINGRPSSVRLNCGLAIAVTKFLVTKESRPYFYKTPDVGTYIVSFSRIGKRPSQAELEVAKGELMKMFPSPVIWTVPDGPVDVVTTGLVKHHVIRWWIEWVAEKGIS